MVSDPRTHLISSAGTGQWSSTPRAVFEDGQDRFPAARAALKDAANLSFPGTLGVSTCTVPPRFVGLLRKINSRPQYIRLPRRDNLPSGTGITCTCNLFAILQPTNRVGMVRVIILLYSSVHKDTRIHCVRFFTKISLMLRWLKRIPHLSESALVFIAQDCSTVRSLSIVQKRGFVLLTKSILATNLYDVLA